MDRTATTAGPGIRPPSDGRARVATTIDAGRLAATVTGSVVGPDNSEFWSFRKPFLGQLAERLPAAVLQCADVSDVVQAVKFARVHQVPFALRSGGHSFADFCTTSGLLVDLGRLDAVEIGPQVVTVGPAVRLGTLAQRLAEHGRATSCGWNPQVAVAGAVLGGGFGAWGRSFGLGCDQLQAVQVVLADGSTVWADEQREPDLFWAMRGAGWGSFGVVTALVLRTRPAPRVTTFVHRWPWHRAAELVHAWQQWAPDAGEDINAEVSIQVVGQQAEPKVTLFGAVLADAVSARSRLTEFLHSLDPTADLEEMTELSPQVAPVRHSYAGRPVIDRPLAAPPAGTRPWLRVVRSEFFDQPLTSKAIVALFDTLVADRAEGQGRELEFIPWGGAYQRVAPGQTAFAHRDCRFQIGHHGMVANQASDGDRAAVVNWARRSWGAVHPWGAGRVYPNYPDPDLPNWGQAYYAENLPRLSEVKGRYDPADVFRFAQSIPLPSLTGGPVG